jgi:hypothetical protein
MTCHRFVACAAGIMLVSGSLPALNVFPGSGNVGIGTSSPAYPLNVVVDVGNAYTAGVFLNYASHETAYSQFGALTSDAALAPAANSSAWMSAGSNTFFYAPASDVTTNGILDSTRSIFIGNTGFTGADVAPVVRR